MSSPKKSKMNKTLSRKKNVPKIEKIPLEIFSPLKTRSQRLLASKTTKISSNDEPVLCASSTTESTCLPSSTKRKTTNNNLAVSPKIIKSYLSAYKLSPEYANLKKKLYNTSFCFETPRRGRDIQVFTPEEKNPAKWGLGELGDKYANAFMSIPEMNIDDVEEEIKLIKKEAKKDEKVKRGRKRSVGYKGVPFSDDCLLFDSNSLLTP